ncbi:hypothetical protein DAI22_11g219400 [Oryza sativa Japonica Group]|nr:hypothetical protein DAI22_11g219400 [Oryza sativa Japonica Group]
MARLFFYFETVPPTSQRSARCRRGEGVNPPAAILLAGERRPRVGLLGHNRAQPVSVARQPPLKYRRGEGANLAEAIRYSQAKLASTVWRPLPPPWRQAPRSPRSGVRRPRPTLLPPLMNPCWCSIQQARRWGIVRLTLLLLIWVQKTPASRSVQLVPW